MTEASRHIGPASKESASLFAERAPAPRRNPCRILFLSGALYASAWRHGGERSFILRIERPCAGACSSVR
jgi:hypothetical protein